MTPQHLAHENPISRIERARALEILSAMGQQGVPPARDALLVNVATEEMLYAIDQAHLEPLAANPRLSAFKVVRGNYGAGKTQFLYSLRELAWRRGFAVAYVPLSPTEGAFDKLSLVYQRLARSIALMPDDEQADVDEGVPLLLSQWLRQRSQEASNEELREWIEEDLIQARVENPSFLAAAVRYLQDRLDHDLSDQKLIGSWLSGEPIRGRRQKQRLHELHVRDVLREESALSWMCSLTQLIRALDIPGVLLLFDEAEQNISLAKRARRRAADHMRTFIDYTASSRLIGTLSVYAATEEFFASFVSEYDALKSRIDERHLATPRTPENVVVDLEHIGCDEEQFLRALGQRFLDTFLIAYPQAGLDPGMQRRNVAMLADRFAQISALEGASVRRRFVKALYAMLLAQRAEPHVLGESDMEQLSDRIGDGMETHPLPGEVTYRVGVKRAGDMVDDVVTLPSGGHGEVALPVGEYDEEEYDEEEDHGA